MRTFRIEAGIPIPPAPRPKRRARLPLWKLKVGDSFAIRCPPTNHRKAALRVRWSVAEYAKRYPGTKFVTRTAPDNRSIRVWRTA